MEKPVVDILMATYNGERYIAEQIESIQGQTYQNWRLLVSDDCSTDGTLAIVKSYAEKDSRVQVVSEGVRYGGAKENFMFLLTQSSAPYAMFCDQDDVWLPEKIELSLTVLCDLEKVHPESPCLVFTDMKVVDATLNSIHPSFEHDSKIDPSRTRFSQVLAQSLGAGCTMAFNLSLIVLMSDVNSDNGMIMHDYWATLVAAAFGSIGYIDKPTNLYRQHDDNSIGADHFSVFERASNMGRMKERYVRNVKQAVAFRNIYASKLDERQRTVIDAYCSTIDGPVIHRLFALIRSGCWKKGLRKIGQIAVVLGGVQ